MLVYKVTNLINNKIYIGYTTKSLEERKRGHIYKINNIKDKHYFYLFSLALKKYGIENFQWEIIEQCLSKEHCQKREIYYIEFYNSISPNGYNLTKGGNGGIQSKETKDKISETVKKYWDENKDKHHWSILNQEKRKLWANKSWLTKRTRLYVPKNRIKWVNIYTKETAELSITEMHIRYGTSVGVYSLIKNNKQKVAKNGWKLLEINN